MANLAARTLPLSSGDMCGHAHAPRVLPGGGGGGGGGWRGGGGGSLWNWTVTKMGERVSTSVQFVPEVGTEKASCG